MGKKEKIKKEKTPKQKKEKIIKGPEFLPSCIGNAMINYQEYYMSAAEKIFFFLLAFVSGGLVGQIFYGGLFKEDGEPTTATYISSIIIFVIIGGVVAKIVLPIIEKMLKEKRQLELRDQFRDLLEILTTALASGNTVTDSFVNARNDILGQYTEKDYIVIELAEIVNGLENGVTLENLISNFGSRSGLEDIQNFSNVIGNCYRMGGNFKDVVRRTKDIISDKMAITDEINTKLASNKMQLNAMSLMPILLVGMIKAMNPTFAENLASPVGVLVTTLAICGLGGAYFWGQKIINIEG